MFTYPKWLGLSIFDSGWSRRKRAGLTLTEVIVVCGILMVLAAVTIPAVLRSRATSRRVQCQSNLRQLGTLANDFHSMHGRLPTAGFLREMLVQVDPRLEEFMQIRFEPNQAPPWKPPSIYYCPSDPLVVPPNEQISYLLNAGSKVLYHDGLERFKDPPTGYLDPMHGFAPVRFSDVTDGLSNTALSFESLYLINTQSDDPVNYNRRLPHGLARHYEIGEEDELLQDAREIRRTGQRIMSTSIKTGSLGFTFMYSNEIPYNHVGPPNEWIFDTDRILGMRPPSSFHQGGVNGVVLDGHVVFITNDIDLNIWRAMGSINGQDK